MVSFDAPADIVARELLGKILVRVHEGKQLHAKIVETEAYFDEKDPASRACQGGDLRKTMLMEPGVILVYGVHNNWLLNFVVDKSGIAGAVLIRAVEPLNFFGNGKGPGLVCRCLAIDKKLHQKKVGEQLFVTVNTQRSEPFIVERSARIGVRTDLLTPMRFYIKGNKWVSKTKVVKS